MLYLLSCLKLLCINSKLWFLIYELLQLSEKKTLVALIPDKHNASSIKDSKSTSLLSSSYELLVEVLANRLKSCLDSTIHDTQGAFIQNRQILDDRLLVAKKLIDSKIKSEKKAVLSIKWTLKKLMITPIGGSYYAPLE